MVDRNEGSNARPPGARAPDRSAGLKAQIDENLKRAYQATLAEAVPDRFTQLLAQLKDKEQGK